jgi:hypothetical protein
MKRQIESYLPIGGSLNHVSLFFESTLNEAGNFSFVFNYENTHRARYNGPYLRDV